MEQEHEFGLQTGGHQGAFIQTSSNNVLKRVSDKELHFYEKTLSDVPDLKPLVPTFYGSTTRDGNSTTHT